MSGPEGKHGVQGGDAAAAGGEVEVVGVAVLGEAAIGGFGELGLEEGQVGFEPGFVVLEGLSDVLE